MFWSLGAWNRGVSWALLSLKSLRDNPCLAQLLMVPGIPELVATSNSNFSPSLYMAFFPLVCLSASSPLPVKTSVVGFRTHPKSGIISPQDP